MAATAVLMVWGVCQLDALTRDGGWEVDDDVAVVTMDGGWFVAVGRDNWERLQQSGWRAGRLVVKSGLAAAGVEPGSGAAQSSADRRRGGGNRRIRCVGKQRVTIAGA